MFNNTNYKQYELQKISKSMRIIRKCCLHKHFEGKEKKNLTKILVGKN